MKNTCKNYLWRNSWTLPSHKKSSHWPPLSPPLKKTFLQKNDQQSVESHQFQEHGEKQEVSAGRETAYSKTEKRRNHMKRKKGFLPRPDQGARNDKWISGLDYIRQKSTSRDLMDGEARSCVENSRRELPKPVAAFHGWYTRNRENVETIVQSKSTESFYPFFHSTLFLSLFLFLPPWSLCPPSRIGRTIYFRRVKTSDWWRHDANSTMWEPIVTRSHRRGITKTRLVRFGGVIPNPPFEKTPRLKLRGISLA